MSEEGGESVAEVEIYTTPFCPFCHRAKSLLKKKGVGFTEIDVMMSPGKRREMMERAGGQRSVPQIFVDGQHVGDCDQIYEMEFDGTLDAALKIAPSA